MCHHVSPCTTIYHHVQPCTTNCNVSYTTKVGSFSYLSREDQPPYPDTKAVETAPGDRSEQMQVRKKEEGKTFTGLYIIPQFPIDYIFLA